MSDLTSPDPINPSNLSDPSQQWAVLSEQVATLTQRVTSLEEKLLLVPDIERYSRLQQFLSSGHFKEADLETNQVILETVAMKRDDLAPEILSKFPCNVLQVIDRLWRTYSQDRFGFSIQLEIYEKGGGNLDSLRTQDRKIMASFAREVGWMVDGQVRFDVYDQWDFSLNAPRGCFPAIWWKSPYGLKMVTFFFMRLFECNI
jgi:hypothetical protein